MTCQKNLASELKSSFTSINHIFRVQFQFFTDNFNEFCYFASEQTSHFLFCEQKQREGCMSEGTYCLTMCVISLQNYCLA